MTRHTSVAFALLPALVMLGCAGGRETGRIIASGHVEATDVRISAKVGGTLESFSIEEGDRVTLGQELGRIDTTDTRLALDAAKAERDQADAQLRLALAGFRKEDIAAAEAQVSQAEADLDGAEKDLARMLGLLDTGSGTAKSRDDARPRRDVAAAGLAAARDQLRKLRAGSRREEIDAARARLAAAVARIAQLEQQLHDAVVKSPLAGIVTEKVAEQGEILPPGSTLCIVTDLADAWLTIYVAETDLGRIRIGQEAEVVTDEGQHRKGTITFISSEAEFTPKNVQTREERVKLVYKVKVGVDNRDGLFKPGMPAEAHLEAVGARA